MTSRILSNLPCIEDSLLYRDRLPYHVASLMYLPPFLRVYRLEENQYEQEERHDWRNTRRTDGLE